MLVTLASYCQISIFNLPSSNNLSLILRCVLYIPEITSGDHADRGWDRSQYIIGLFQFVGSASRLTMISIQ
ncbi:hypothetical protein FGO68_gene10601 [Halteria grandinella]|uniref:Uncharacterized protein n=1 Tax=Halteria grandinella TaxID=5974 RepID=A0A8J8NWZ6_HALGN|nr:hypothetical protein FGO68_gene10601 [Halteria grandinella]